MALLKTYANLGELREEWSDIYNQAFRNKKILGKTNLYASVICYFLSTR